MCFVSLLIRQAHGLYFIRLKSTTQKWFHATLTWIFCRNAVRISTASPRKIITHWLRFLFTLYVCFFFVALISSFTHTRFPFSWTSYGFKKPSFFSFCMCNIGKLSVRIEPYRISVDRMQMRDMRTPLIHARTSNTRIILGNSMRNQPYAKIIYKCDLLIELSLKNIFRLWTRYTFHPLSNRVCIYLSY